MTAEEVHSDALEFLAAGRSLRVVESAKTEAVSLAGFLERAEETPVTSARYRERLDALLTEAEDRSTRLLAVAFALVEHAPTPSLQVLPRVFEHLARVSSLVQLNAGFYEHGADVVIGRLVWPLTAFALHCRRLEAIVAMHRATVDSPYSDMPMTLITHPNLRHSTLLERSGGQTYRYYEDWMAQGALIERAHPLFAPVSRRLLAEADVLLALLTVRDLERKTYSHALDRGPAVSLARRFADPAQRRALCRLFRADDDAIKNAAEQAYARLTHDNDLYRHVAPPPSLFSEGSAD